MAALPKHPAYQHRLVLNNLLRYALKTAAASSFWCCQLISPGVTA